MTALPSALYRLGWPAGVSLLLAVAALNYFSQQILVHGSECTGAGTYARLSHATGGRALAAATRISVFLFCFGFATVYLCAMGG
jgi:amino acid permease